MYDYARLYAGQPGSSSLFVFLVKRNFLRARARAVRAAHTFPYIFHMFVSYDAYTEVIELSPHVRHKTRALNKVIGF